MEEYPDLERQRLHLVEQKTPEGRAMVMIGINHLLDQMIDNVEYDTVEIVNSPEGERHLAGNDGRGNE